MKVVLLYTLNLKMILLSNILLSLMNCINYRSTVESNFQDL